MTDHRRQLRLLLQLCCIVLLGAALVAGFQLAPPSRIASRRVHGVRGTCMGWDGIGWDEGCARDWGVFGD